MSFTGPHQYGCRCFLRGKSAVTVAILSRFLLLDAASPPSQIALLKADANRLLENRLNTYSFSKYEICLEECKT